MATNQTLIDPQLDGLRGSEAGDALLNDLRKAIETGQLAHGHKIAPLRSLAKRYNISVTTARAAIMQLAALNLVDARQGSGTYVTFRGTAIAKPAQAAGIELVTVKDAHVIERLAAEVVSGLQDRGRTVISVGWRTPGGVEQLDQVLARWRANPPEAIVLQVAEDNLDEKIDAVCGGQSKIITVFRNHYRPRPTDSVEPDRLEGYRLATATLLEQGHKRIGLVMAPRAISAHQPWTLRKRTMWNTDYILAAGKVVRAAGKPNTISVHYEQLYKGVVDPWRDPNLDKIEQWLKRADRPTAIVGDDFRVAPAVRVAERMGLKLGRDLAVIGIGNTPWAEAFGFSSVSYREDVMARHVVDLLCKEPNAAGGEEQAESVQHIMVLPKLVVR